MDIQQDKELELIMNKEYRVLISSDFLIKQQIEMALNINPNALGKFLYTYLCTNCNVTYSNWTIKIKKYPLCPNYYRVIIHDDVYTEPKFKVKYYIIPRYTKNNKLDKFLFVSFNEFKKSADLTIANSKDNKDPKYILYGQNRKLAIQFVSEMQNTLKRVQHDFDKFSRYVKDLQDTFHIAVNEEINSKVKLDTLQDFINKDYTEDISTYITVEHPDVETFKYNLVVTLVSLFNSLSTKLVRDTLLYQYQNFGIEYIVDKVEYNPDLNLGVSYRSVRNLITYNNSTYEKIIKYFFSDGFGAYKLGIYLRQVLKLFYESKHANERNADLLYQFLEANNITKEQFENAFNRPLPPEPVPHEGGGPRNYRKRDGEYAVKKIVYLRKTMSAKNPNGGGYITKRTTAKYGQELLDRLRLVMDIYNKPEHEDEYNPAVQAYRHHKQHTKLVDIDFGPEPDSFVFKYVTDIYEDTDVDDIDGKKLSGFTYLYNHNDNFNGEQIYFRYKNG